MPNDKQQNIAAKVFLRNKAGEILLQKQNDPTITGDGKYHPVGGIVDYGETVTEALLREVKEEIGVTCSNIRFLDYAEWTAKRGEMAMQFVGLFFVADIGEGELQLQEDEVAEVSWVTADTLDQYTVLEPSLSQLRAYFDNASSADSNKG